MLRRTSYPANMAIGINYWDRDRKQRWGIWVRETAHTVTVRNILEEVTEVPIQDVIGRKVLDPFYLKTNRTLQDTLDRCTGEVKQ